MSFLTGFLNGTQLGRSGLTGAKAVLVPGLILGPDMGLDSVKPHLSARVCVVALEAYLYKWICVAALGDPSVML